MVEEEGVSHDPGGEKIWWEIKNPRWTKWAASSRTRIKRAVLLGWKQGMLTGYDYPPPGGRYTNVPRIVGFIDPEGATVPASQTPTSGSPT